MTKFYVDAQGRYIGGFDGAEPPAGSIEVPTAPGSATDIFVAGVWYERPSIPQYTAAIQVMLDDKARERNYDNILSACTYVTSTVQKFQSEGQACANWRDAVWSASYLLMESVQNGDIEQPTILALLAMLPTMEWPV